MYGKRVLISLIALLLGVSFCFAELSSQSKKAERSIGKGNIDEAMTIYKELTEKYDKKNPVLVKEGKDGMAKCLLLKAKESFKNSKFADAKIKADQIVTSFADSPSLKEGQAMLVAAQVEISTPLAGEGKYSECLEQSKAVQAKVSADTEGLDRLKAVIGTCLFAQADTLAKGKKFSDAAPILESIVKDYPQTEKIIDARNALATALAANAAAALDQNKIDEATALFQRIAKDFPENTGAAASAHYGLSAILLKAGNQQDALTHSKEASKLVPGNSEYLFQYAGLLQETGDAEAAKTAYTALLGLLQTELQKTYLNKENIQYKLGQTYLRLGNYTEAAVEFDKALSRNPLMTEAREGLAKAQFNDKNFAGAALSYNQLITQLSTEFEKAKSKLSAEKDSLEAAKRLEDLRKQIAFFHYQNGLVYEQTGDNAKAMEECRLGFEGVSTQEAAATLKRLQNAALKKAPAETK